MQNGGTVTISSGTVTANGGDFAAGIGGAYTGNGGTVTITGGTVTANGGVQAAGIGGGVGGSGGNVIITGGSIRAAGSRSNIGAGYVGANDGTLTNGFVPVALTTIANAVAAVNPTEVSYQIPIAGNNPDYSYIYTYTGTGHGGGDTNLYFYLPPAELPAPTTLTAAAVSSSQINLTWVDSDTTEQGFKIERCGGVGCSSFVQIATVSANVTSYSNTNLTGSTSYSYRVRAYNASGNSNYSNTASAVTPAAPALPAAPSSLTAAVISKNQINLSRVDNGGNETGFRVERCSGSTCTNFTVIATVGANVTSYANTNLTANTTYRYRVYAYNAGGNSGYSNISTATTRKR
jgi:predicted phage tail protein